MKNEEQFSLEASLKEIREIVEKMQMSSMDFDENVRLFKAGSELINASRSYLDESELLIKKLIEGENE